MSFQPKPRHIPWHLIVIFFLLAIGIGASGYFYYKNQKEHIKKAKAEELSAIADLKVNQISSWRKERFGDATVIFESLLIPSAIKQCLENPKDSKLRRNITTWMTSLQKNYDYARVILFDSEGTVKLSLPEKSKIVKTPVLAAGCTKQPCLTGEYATLVGGYWCD